jgi:hypothetical protein
VFWLALFILIDELWARQENRKTFNWLALLDDGIIAGVAAMVTQYGDFRQASVTAPGWPVVLTWVAGAVAAAAVIEYLRPYVPHERNYQPEDTSRLEAEIGAFVEEGRPWVYCEIQNPAWMSWGIVATVVAFLVGAYQAFAQARADAIVLGLVGLAMVFLYGGLRVMVTPERLQVRWGVFGIPLLRLRLAELTSVQVHEFSPLREFGGYGIRFNRRMKAYYFRGNRGVLVETERGKKYLIGSDHPERLAAVLDVARRMAGG